MFYMFKMTIFVSTHNYLLKSLKFVIEQNHFIDLTIDSPIIVIVNLYNLIPKRTIKAFLPRNYGDMESPTVTIFDGGIRGQSNNLDFYSFVDYVVQYGMNVNQVLEIIVTKFFTSHQLADTIICKLPQMIQKYRSNIVIILHLFATYKQLHLSEMKWLLGHMVKSIHNIPESIIAAVFSPVVIDYFRKVIDNKLKKTKIPTNKQNREMK
jgi:hypothetical protein